MKTSTFTIASALAAVVAAVPMDKRDVKWVVATEEVVETAFTTTTMWVPAAGASSSAGEFYPQEDDPSWSAPGGTWTESYEGSKPTPQPYKSSSSTPVAAPVTSTSSTPAPVPTTSSLYTPPTSSTTEPATTTPATSAAPVPTTTSEAPAPVASTSTPAAPSAAATSSSSSSGSSSGTTYTGDITYYEVGLGSCGQTNTDSEMIVALPHVMMEAEGAANPNANPLCGKTITIQNGDKTATATVADTCPGCSGDSIDLSPAVFTQLADESQGRVSGVKWWFSG